MKCIVVACGRSGTGLVASILNQSGNACGHESVFTPYITEPGIVPDFTFESSWLAAPFIDKIEGLTHIVHVVRNPELVINSFVRLGVFSSLPIRYVTKGHMEKFIKDSVMNPYGFLDRLNYCSSIRRYLKHHSRSFNYKSETKRIEAYWRDWNLMIEEKSKRARVSYVRFTLNQVSNQPQQLLDWLGLKVKSNEQLVPDVVNKKDSYKGRFKKNQIDIETYKLAEHYGLF